MIFHFYGKDRFLTKLEAGKKISEFVDQGFKKIVLEGIEGLKQAVKSDSLFSEKIVFVFITEKLREDEKKVFKEITFADENDQIFIFVEKGATPSLLFGRTKVNKVKISEVNGKWLKQQAKEFGIEAEKDLADYFFSDQFKEFDSGFFYFELLKLSLYKPGVKVELKDYLEISQGKQELNYFDWIKAVLTKDTAKALKFIPDNEYEALGRLKSLINIFELILVAEGEVSPGDSQKFLSKNSPFWVKNIRQWAGKMSYQQKFESLEKLLDFEVGVKTGRLSSVEALKLFIIG